MLPPFEEYCTQIARYHKHIPPDIKHHRIPSPGISFTEPNLPLLIQEVEQLLTG